MKLGYIDYLNCFPFYYRMFLDSPVSGVEIYPGYPSFLNKSMGDGTLDMSPISAAAYADNQERLLILPQFCLSSIGYVKSVILVSKLPIEELDGKRVGLTSASKTSQVLLKLILEKYYKLKPEYLPAPPDPDLDDFDAALIIGNDAMKPEKKPYPYSYDLGDLWLRKTGYPVVFALFAVQKSVVETDVTLIEKVIASYSESLGMLYKERSTLIEAAKKRYPGIFYDIDEYYSLLKYDFTDNLKKAVQFYFDEASSLGLLPKVDEIKFFST